MEYMDSIHIKKSNTHLSETTRQHMLPMNTQPRTATP